MNKFLKLAKRQGAEYAEVKQLEAKKTNIEVSQKEIKELSSGDFKMFSVRVLVEGGWGIAYSYKNDYEKLIQNAIKNARRVDEKVSVAALDPCKDIISTKLKINPLDIPIEDKRERVLDLGKQDFKNISNLRLIYSDTLLNYTFLNSEGTDLKREDMTSGFVAWAFSKDSDNMQNFLKIDRIRGGYEVMDNSDNLVNSAVKKAQDLLKARHAKGGIFPTIVDQKLAGVLAHEAVGHACEADLVLTHSSVLVNMVGKKIGNEILNICDDGRKKVWGWTPYDAEGVKASKTQLIKNGILKGYLHNRETAAKFKTDPTGNGRVQNHSFKPIPRMTNTIIEKGDSKFEEMVQEIKKGYYLKGSAGGQVDPAGGEFLFNAQEGYFIENGEIKHMVKGVSLIGNVMETLHNIKMIAKDTEFGTGFCGKSGQTVPVSEASPHVFIMDAKVGGNE